MLSTREDYSMRKRKNESWQTDSAQTAQATKKDNLIEFLKKVSENKNINNDSTNICIITK